MLTFLILLFSASALQAAPSASAVKELTLKDFNNDLSWEQPLEGLYRIEVGLNAPSVNLMAYADLNNDHFTDIITLND